MFSKDPAIPPKALKQVIEAMIEDGLLQENPDPAQFVDDSYRREALQQSRPSR